MNTRLKKLTLTLYVSTFASASPAAILNLNLIDDILKVGGTFTGPGSYDVIDATTGMAGSDGFNDLNIVIATSGLGDDGNNVTWAANTDTNATGLRSTISPSFNGAGGVTANNSGHRARQTIDILFLPTLSIFAENITDFGWSSGNTAGTVWETSILQYLDENGDPFSSAPTLSLYSSHTPIAGQSGIGTFVADSTGVVLGVGTDLTATGTSGSGLDSLSTTPGGLGISNGTRIGGVRVIHSIEDVRGINNGTASLSNTINDLAISGATAIPEPSAVSFVMVGFLSFLLARRRKREGRLD